MRNGRCEREKCNYTHLQGTVRERRPKEVDHRTDARDQDNAPISTNRPSAEDRHFLETGAVNQRLDLFQQQMNFIMQHITQQQYPQLQQATQPPQQPPQLNYQVLALVQEHPRLM